MAISRERRRPVKRGRLSRRKHEVRRLLSKDIDRSIQAEWKNDVKELSNRMIKSVAEAQSIDRKQAAKLLKEGKDSIAKTFSRGGVLYTLEYRYSDGKFYWTSTRRRT